MASAADVAPDTAAPRPGGPGAGRDEPPRTAALGAVVLVARAELRTRWRGLVALGLLLGLVGGIVLGAVAVAARTSSAYARLVVASGMADAELMVPAVHTTVFGAVPEMPGVTASWTPVTWRAQVNIPAAGTPAKRFVSIKGGGDRPPGLMEPVLLRGRLPRPDAADEVLAGEGSAAVLGVDLGDEVILRMLRPDQIAQLNPGDPQGAFARVHIVGVARAPARAEPAAGLVVSPAFVRQYASDISGRGVYVRLRSTDSATRAAFAATMAAAVAADPTPSPLDADPAYSPEPSFPTFGIDPTVRAAQVVLLVGLSVFGAVVGLGGLLVVTQGLMRHHGARRPVQRIERALGLTLVERATARVLAGSVGALVAGVVGAVVAFAAGRIEPLGNQSRFEPTPGFHPPWAIALLGGLGLALLFMAMTAGAAAVVATRRPTVAPLPSAGFAALGRWPAVLCGLSLAWRGPRAAGGIRTTATVAGLALAVTGIVATVTIGASMQRLVDTPQRYGRNADIVVVNARDADIDDLVTDPRVAAVDVVTGVPVTLNRDPAPVKALSAEHRKGAMPVETVTGRPPLFPGEIALQPRSAHRLGLKVGQTVLARPASGRPVRLTVTGIVVSRGAIDDPLGDGGIVVPAQLRELSPGATPEVTTYVRVVPGRSAFLFRELSSRLLVFPTDDPPAIRNLVGLLVLPRLLAVALAVVGGAAVVHTLVSAGRRHGPDLAVLAALGATPHQVRATLSVAAVAMVLPALVVGVPVGLGAARVVWWEVATSTGVGPDASFPIVLLVGVVLLLVAGALLATVVPAGRAVRTPPAAALVGE